MLASIEDRWPALGERLEGAGRWLAPLGLRWLLAWEFWEAGLQKLHGSNWFAGIRADFPFPFNHAPADLSWTLATWAELVGAVALALGLGTRFFALVLLVLTAVATAAVHWPGEWASLGELWRGYAITDRGHGNFKLPLLFAAMLLPLVFHGAGRLSLDAWIATSRGHWPLAPRDDLAAAALAAALLAVPALMLVPTGGITLLALAAGLVLARRALG